MKMYWSCECGLWGEKKSDEYEEELKRLIDLEELGEWNGWKVFKEMRCEVCKKEVEVMRGREKE